MKESLSVSPLILANSASISISTIGMSHSNVTHWSPGVPTSVGNFIKMIIQSNIVASLWKSIELKKIAKEAINLVLVDLTGLEPFGQKWDKWHT